MATTPKTMKALTKSKEGESFEYGDVPVPEPTGDEVLIKVDAVSICGSDINMYKWNDVARIICTIPFIPGHECAGTVVKCGPDADLSVGSKVGVENHYFCGECFQCKNDTREICMNMGQYGHGKKTPHGGCSEYSIVPAKYLYKLTRDLTPDQIAMLEPLGVAHNAAERLDCQDEDVLIIGCGAIGILAQCVAKSMGARRVIAADIDDDKLAMAKSLAADVTVNTMKTDLKEFILSNTDGVGIGRICECSGSSVMVNSTFTMLRKGGQIVLVGLPKQPLHVENVLQDVVFKCLTLKTVHGRRVFSTWKKIEQLVADGKVNVDKVITHRFPLSKFEDAYQVLMSGKACKIVMYPSA